MRSVVYKNVKKLIVIKMFGFKSILIVFCPFFCEKALLNVVGVVLAVIVAVLPPLQVLCR